MVAITSVTISELGEAVVYFDATVHVSKMSSGVPYTLTATTPLAVPVCVYDAEVLGGAQSAKFWISPPLSPTADYTLSVEITDSAGATNTAATTITAPNVAKPLSDEWYHGVLKAWSRAVSQSVQELSGIPITVLVKDVRPGDDKIFVESTLGFPDSGFVHVGRLKFRYGARGPACFHDVTFRGPSWTRAADALQPLQLVQTVHARQVVASDVTSSLPAGAYAYLTAEGVPLDDPNGIL